jgi:hypothetical protein
MAGDTQKNFVQFRTEIPGCKRNPALTRWSGRADGGLLLERHSNLNRSWMLGQQDDLATRGS